MSVQADTVVTTIALPSGSSPHGVAINPAGTYAYVTRYSSNVVSKIDLANDSVVATIGVGNSPYRVAITPAGTYAYVTNLASKTVSKIDLANDTLITTILFPPSFIPYDVAINPAGTYAYVTNVPGCSNTVGRVSKIDLANDTVVSTITAGGCPQGVAITPAGTFAYVTNLYSNTVSKIDLANDTVVTTIALPSGSRPIGVAINPAGTHAYVTNSNSSTVSKINLAQDVVSATITVGVFPIGVAINPAGTYAYVTGAYSNGAAVSKIDLSNDSVVATIGVGSPQGVAINPAGTFAYVTNENGVLKLNVPSDSQTITFVAGNQLLGAKTVALSATASSNLAVAFTSASPTVCTISGSTVTLLTTGDCTINANQVGGPGWDAATQVSRTFTILPSPPSGEVGVSIKNGSAYINTKIVVLNLVWPEYATAVRISNDGGFAGSQTQTKDLAASIDWELDDSVKGIYTKVVYVRFNGVADTTKTYSDDIILDTTAPTIESSSAAIASSSVEVLLKATDDITGVDKVELKNGSSTVTKDYAANLSVPMKEIGITVSSASVRKLGTSSIEIRVSDKAGNWSAYKLLSVSGTGATPTVTTPTVTTPTVTTPTVTTPTVTTPTVTKPTVTMPKLTKLRSATAKSIATFAKLKVLSTSKVKLKVAASSSRFCRVSGTTLKGLKAGSCKVTVTVTPKKGKAISKTVTLKVTK
jgi:YVTN family beta-propeller protein